MQQGVKAIGCEVCACNGANRTIDDDEEEDALRVVDRPHGFIDDDELKKDCKGEERPHQLGLHACITSRAVKLVDPHSPSVWVVVVVRFEDSAHRVIVVKGIEETEAEAQVCCPGQERHSGVT